MAKTKLIAFSLDTVKLAQLPTELELLKVEQLTVGQVRLAGSPVVKQLIAQKIETGEAQDWLRSIAARKLHNVALFFIRHDNSKLRRAASETINLLGWSDLLPENRQLLSDWNMDVQLTAMKTVQKLQDNKAKPQLIELLKHNDEKIRREALKTLQGLPKPLGTEALKKLLADERPYVRVGAIQLIGQDGDINDIGKIREKLRDPEPEVHAAVINALELLGDSQSLPAIKTFLEQKSSSDINKTAARFILKHGNAQDLPAIKLLLQKNEKEEYWGLLAEAIGEWGKAEDYPLLVQILTSSVKYNIDKYLIPYSVLANAITSLNARERTPTLEALLTNEDDKVRQYVINLIRELKLKDYLPDLKERLSDPNGAVCVAAVKAIDALDGKEYLPDLKKLLPVKNLDLTWPTILAIGNFSKQEDLPYLKSLLTYGNLFVRTGAVVAIGRLGGAEDLNDVAKLFDEEMGPAGSWVYEAILDLIIKFQAKQYLPIIIAKFLNETGNSLGSQAVRVIKELGGQEELSILDKVLSNGWASAYDKINALDGVGRIGGPEAVRILVQALAIANEAVVAVAVKNLGRQIAKDEMSAFRERLVQIIKPGRSAVDRAVAEMLVELYDRHNLIPELHVETLAKENPELLGALANYYQLKATNVTVVTDK